MRRPQSGPSLPVLDVPHTATQRLRVAGYIAQFGIAVEFNHDLLDIRIGRMHHRLGQDPAGAEIYDQSLALERLELGDQ
jgi:hypothetical protein